MNEPRQAPPAAFTQQTRQCRFPGCQTLTLNDYCARHRPQGEWAIAEQVRDEQRLEEQEGDHE